MPATTNLIALPASERRGDHWSPVFFLEPILFFLLLRKKRTVSIFQEKKESNVPTVVLNLTQKISAIIRPLRQSLPSERSLRSAHRLSAEPRSKTNTCGPMSTRKGQAASVTLLRREQLRSASALHGAMEACRNGRTGSSAPTERPAPPAARDFLSEEGARTKAYRVYIESAATNPQ